MSCNGRYTDDELVSAAEAVAAPGGGGGAAAAAAPRGVTVADCDPATDARLAALRGGTDAHVHGPPTAVYLFAGAIGSVCGVVV